MKWLSPIRSVYISRGYTLVEVLVTVAVASIGFVAILDLQTASIRGIGNARSTTQGVHLAEHFIEEVRAMSNACDPSLSDGNCIYTPIATGPGNWTVLGDDSDNMVSPGSIDPTDKDLGISSELPTDFQRHFCIHYRTAWLIESQVMRLDVRVFWPQAETDMIDFKTCSLNLIPDQPGENLLVGLATLSTAIRVNTF